jgi:glutamate dehydrogenase/leucine dehydrogenase
VGRTEATGMGGFFVFSAYAKKKGLKPKLTTIAIQGFGNVGYWFARYAQESGYKVVAISDSQGGTYDKKGINLEKILKIKKEKGKIPANITNEELLELPVDVLVPAALENVITKKNMSKIQAKVIFEMANGPTTSEADDYLYKKGIDVIPDILANAGGVTTSYFEWKQNLEKSKWSITKVETQLKRIMLKAFNDLFKAAKAKKISYRKAAGYLAVKRIADAMKKKGRI